MKNAGIPGRFLAWQDVLHEGPVPDKLSLEELSEVRADYLINKGWGRRDSICASFAKRDAALREFHIYAKVILWFEHDLYDQLQLLQILDWFSGNIVPTDKLTIICTEQYLGEATPAKIQELSNCEEAVTRNQLSLASNGWHAFRSSTPELWEALLREDTAALPFLHGAILRQLEEYPSCRTGLSRSAEKALAITAKGSMTPGKIFAQYQKTEARRFMGDLSFWAILQQLMHSEPPLIRAAKEDSKGLPRVPSNGLPRTELAITAAGTDVLEGRQNWSVTAELDRWIGGVHLSSANRWCWDMDSSKLTRIVS